MDIVNSENDFAEYFNKRTFSDCTVISSCDKKFHVHKIVLCKNQYFRNKLAADPLKISALNMPETADILEDLLYYIYTGKIKCVCKNMKDLFVAAKKYSINGLEAMVSRNLLQTICVENSIETFIFASCNGPINLENDVINFIVKDLKVVMNTANWKLLEDAEGSKLKDKIIGAYIKLKEASVVEPSLDVQQMEV